MKRKLRHLIIIATMTLLTGNAMAQSDASFVIMYDGHYLAHVYNGTTWTLQDATTFSPECIWFSSNNYNYYFNDGTNLRYLSAPLERNGALSLSDSYPGTAVVSNTIYNYFFYDWWTGHGEVNRGLARAIQHPLSECDDIYNSPGTQCWEVVWVSYEDSQWKMSSVYGYNPTTYAARFYPVTVTEHEQVISSETGGAGDITQTNAEMDYPSTNNLDITASDYTYTYTSAYTTYVFNGGTHNYYNNTDNGTNTPTSTTSTGNTVSSYQWTLSGEGATFLTMINDNTASPTLTYSTENTTGHKTATVTATVTYSDGATQTRSAEVLVKTECQNPVQAAEPVVTFEDVTVSWVQTSDHYKVYWKKHSETDYNNSVEVYDDSSYTLTGLTYSTAYDYKVSAYCGGSEITSPAPTVYTFTTGQQPQTLLYGAVFGGGRMANVTGKTEVIIIDCDSIGAIYGGNDIAGEVQGADGSTIVLGVNAGDANATEYNDGNASTKVIIGDVYGGGNGYYAYNGTSFVAASSDYTSHDVLSGGEVRSMTQNHEVNGVVYTNNGTSTKTLSFPSIVKTAITVTNDAVQVDSIFGGAKNAFLTESTGNGSTITVNGGTVYAVFGGNNFGGTQGYGKHHIDVTATKIPATLSPNITSTATTGYGRDFGIRYLFGGGNKVYGSTTEIFITGGMTDTIFAGGNSADVYAANVTVNCALANDYGGYTFGSTYSNAIASSDGTNITVKDNYEWDGTGLYNVHTLFGGNNQATMAGVPNIALTSGSIGTVYGGGNAGDMLAQETDNGSGGTLTINGNSVKYGTHVVLNSPSVVVDDIYGGCQVSNVHYSTWVELKDGHVGTVYGGCNVSGDVGSTRVDLEAPSHIGEDPNPDYQEVYGATYVVATGGTVYKNLFAGGNGFYHCVNEHGYYTDGLDYGDPQHYYIGMTAPTHNETNVVVNTGVTVKGNVYAGGNLACVGFDNSNVGSNPYPTFVGLSSVRMSGGTVEGDVYGGGNMANVYGSNEVQVSGGTITGSLYGGNDRTGKVAQISNRVLPTDYNTASDNITSLLEPNKVYTYVGVTGNPTITNVYGGGNGDYEYFDNFASAAAYTGPKETVVTCDPDNNQPIQRCTFVDIGIDGGDDGGHIGTVYGGGDGVTVTEFLKVFLNVQGTTSVSNVGTIFGGNNKGDLELVPEIVLLNGQVNTVYGGCNEGAMTATGSNLKTIGGYANIGSYVRLMNEYDGDGDGGNDPVTPTAKVVDAVYGGCRMNGVTNNSLVLVEGGDHTNVSLFGGSDISGTVSGTAQVAIVGGTVGNAYGGGNGNYDYTSTAYSGLTPPHCATSGVEMTGGTANYLYAGSYAGTCGDTYANILNGTVNHDVFGGGYGATSSTTGNVTVNIGATTGSYNPTITGDVYGGSALGNVNDASTDLTTVNILSGTLNGDIFGGGLGDATNEPAINGVVHVNIGADDSGTGVGSATINGRIFGCNNANGTPKSNVYVDIYSTSHTTANTYPDDVETLDELIANSPTQQYAIKAVYGGGNLASYSPLGTTDMSQVHVHYCDVNTIDTIYGGGNAANSTNTKVIVDGGRIRQVFGGGNGYSSTGNHNDPSAPSYNPGADITGVASTDINGGLIDQVFGGSNQYGTIGSIDLNIVKGSCPELIINEVFSGNNQATFYGDIVTNLVGDCYDAVNHNIPDGNSYYGGTNLASVYGNVTLNVYGGYYVNVFGGSKGYVDQSNPANNIAADIKRFPTLDEINANPSAYSQDLKDYLASHTDAYGTGGNVTLNIYGGKIENAFGGSDMLGNIEGKITVNVLQGEGDPSITRCPLDLTNVYGSGNITEYNPDSYVAQVGTDRLVPEVNIQKGNVKNNVFGGGLGATATVTANPVVTIGDVASGHESYVAIVGRTENGIDYGNVYGGGELAQVHGNTKVLLQKSNTVVKGTVYGGGKGNLTGNVSDRDAGLVTGNTLVDMRDGNVQRSIYGGGELGSVGTFTAYYYDVDPLTDADDPKYLHIPGEPKACQTGTGLAKVLISGGRVGLNSEPNGLMPDPDEPTSNDDYGYVFCASKGECDSINYPSVNLLAVVDTTYLEISGSAVITASAYGGSENGQVIRNTHVKVTGGQIGLGHYKNASGHHWDAPYTDEAWTTAINKVKAGTFTDADAAGFNVCDAWPFKDEDERFVYDHYAKYKNDADGLYYYDAAFTQSSYGGSHDAGDGHSFFGNVFGGGSGYYPYAPGQWRRSAGRVNGNTYVEVTGGHILTNIYGGNEITDVIGGSKVVMTGGTLGVPRSLDSIQGRPVNCNLFGAGMGDPRIMFNQWSNVASTEVIVGGDAVVFGSVFGGGEDGHVLGNVSTTIKDNALVGTLGTSGVDGNAFGGGRGFSGIALTAGVVCGNVTLNIQDNASILGSVYGGGRMAAVGTYLRPEGDSEYGILQPGDDHGNVTININGGSIGNHHLINATNEFSIGDVYGGSKGTLVKDVAHNQRLGLVKNTTVNIAQPAGKTTRIYGSVYGGGEIGSVGHFNYATADQANQYNATHPSEEMNVGDVYEWVSDGLATINISGGEIGQSNTTDYVKGHVFGGCLGKTGNDFSGYSFVDRSIVTISGGKMYGAVFGGGENGHVYHDTRVNIQGGKIGIRVDSLPDPLPENIIYRGNVYGGGRGIDQDKAYCITAGKVYGNTEVNITGGTIYRNVYGGGSLASVGDTDEIPQPDGSYLTGLATVNVTGGQIGTDGGYSANDYSATPPTRNHLRENGFVYGSGRGVAGPATSEFAYVKNTEVTIGGTAYVTGSVFGGGENGHVRKNTNVTVNNGTGYCHQQAPLAQDIEPYPVIGYPLTTEALVENLQKPIIVYRGNVYGGGRGVDFYIENGVSYLSRTAGVVQGNTVVTINGGTIRHDVYGGGSMASVGTYTYDGTTGEVIGVEAGTGLSTVIVNNGIIGMSPELDIVKQYNTDNDPTSGILHNLSGINNGQVFGGGRGESGSLYKNLAYVDTTNVYIHGGLICGAVFGGGCNGHVKEGTYVSMDAGEIGHELSDYEKTVDFTHPHPIYFGNVYGGGRGIDHANLTSTLSKTAGRVYGNTRVDISGGVVHHDVYGGGSLANVGTYTEDAGGITYISGGTAIVNITGTADIGTNVTTGSAADIANAVRNSGYVYGSGRGMAGSDWSDMAYVKETYVNIGTEGGSDNPMVKASVFGGGSNGHVYRDTHVNIYTGTIGTPLTAEEMVEIDPSQTHTAHRPRVYRGNVYGGGRGVERDISGGTPVLSETAGRVFGNTNVTVAGGKIYHNIYGGGSLASVGTYTIDGTGHHIFNTGTGIATITVNGGVVGMSPDEASTISGATQWHTGLNSGQIYGSGRGEAGAEYSGMAFTDNTYVNINGGTVYGAVFGGGANGHVKHDTHVAINGGTIGVDDITANQFSVYRGNVYGGGRGIDLDGSGYVSPTAGMVYGNTEVTVTGGTIYHNVFGGGSLASVGTTTGAAPDLTFENTTGSTNVTISGGTIGINGINNGRVFGAGRGYPNPNLIDLAYVKETNVNILHGANIKGCVFGSGDNGQVYNDTYITMTGGTIGTNGSANEGNIFGGGRGQDTYGSGLLSPTAGIVYGNTNVDVSGGIVKANIYGGGDLSTVGKYAFNIDGSGNVTGINTIDPNTGTTNVIVRGDVTVGGSSYGNVFGAGRGDQTRPLFARVNYTNVTIGDNSSQPQLNNVYGGGENGNVTCGVIEEPTVSAGNVITEVASIVTMTNGEVSTDVYGGGDQGNTQGQVIVNMNGGIIHGELFGGAKGSQGSVFVAGLKTVNVRGGTVYNHVYGGSRNANDGLYLDANATNQDEATEYVAFVNISGGLLRGDVYGAGYYGLMFGSSDVNLGKTAIDLANSKNIRRGEHTPAYLQIIKNVYAGSNWGEYDPAVPFASSTTTGHSNVFLDGYGYDTQTLTPPANTTTSTFMDLGGSIYGSGTSGDAGTKGRKIQIANFGHPINATQTLFSFDGNHSADFTVLNSSTRSMQSVQRCDTLIIDNATVQFTGQGDISQNFNTVEYALMYIDKGVYVRNGSNIVANTQIDEIHALFSQYRPETIGGVDNGIYTKDPTTYWIGIGESDHSFYYINGSTATSLATDMINTMRFNGGYSMYVRYNKQYINGNLMDISEETFGELNGFFRMVTETDNETFAHARPKITESGSENVSDGGFMSYYDEYHNNFTDAGANYTKGLQFPYLNVLQTSKADRPDYRYWRIRASQTGNQMVSPMAFFLYSNPSSTEDFITIERTITLPTLECTDDAYYVFSSIDYGDHAHLVNAAIDEHDNSSKYWIVQKEGSTYEPQFYGPDGPSSSDALYYAAYSSSTQDMRDHPNTYFGLVIVPEGSLEGVANPSNPTDVNKEYLISNSTAEMLTLTSGSDPAKFYYPADPNGKMAKVTIRLTYYKEMTMSMALSPISIELKSFCGSSTSPMDIISIPIYITTQTALGQDMTTTSYAMFGDLATGNNPETYNVKATMPPFVPIGEDVPFYVYDLDYDPHQSGAIEFEEKVKDFAETDYNYAMLFKRGFNSDNKSGWREAIDSADTTYFQVGSTFNPVRIGSADGRTPFSIDFTLFYNSCTPAAPHFNANETIGQLTFRICYPKSKDDIGLTPNPNDSENWAKFEHFNIHINLYKRDRSTGFYLDGIVGSNNYSGAYANYGMKTLQSIIDHNWMPGDKVWVVRPIDLSSSATTWTSNNGAPIVLYRYPGSFVDVDHYDVDAAGEGLSWYKDNNASNPVANTGVYSDIDNTGGDHSRDDEAIFANINTKAHLVLDNIILDGYGGDETNPQIRPLIKVTGGGTVTLTQNSEIRNSNNHQDDAQGSAVYVGERSTLILMNGVSIHDNTITNTTDPGNGGAIYLDKDGTLSMGGLVTIKGNTVNGTTNNVYLHVEDPTSNDDIKDAVITIGQDGMDPGSIVGVTKTAFYEDGDLKDLTPIATSIYSENIHNAYTYDIFKDDTRRAYTHYFIENTLYFGKTWAHFVTSAPTGFDVENIDSKEDLAWLLSFVNGLNGSAVHDNVNAVLTADVNMSEHYWKPMGIIEEGGCPNGFVGEFDGQWNVIDGLVIKREGFHNIGFFDNVGENGIVKNVVLGNKDSEIHPWNPDPVEQYAGGIVGTVMKGGTVTACEAAPNLDAYDATSSTYMGGVAGRVDEGGMMHSCIGMPNLRGYTMGGLVGKIESGGYLVNSYTVTGTYESLSSSNNYIGGLVGKVLADGYVENCYVRTGVEPASGLPFGWFVGSNAGTVNYCYAPAEKTNYIYYGGAPAGHGNFDPVLDDIKAIGYLYDDNKVTLASGQSNSYHSETITYASGKIDKWPGMLSALSHWVTEKNAITDDTSPYYNKHFTPWFRPNTTNINGDMPVLGVNNYVSMSTNSEDVNLVRYDQTLDGTLTRCNADDTNDSYVLHYGKDVNVQKVPDANVNVFINEDAVLLQKASSKADPGDFNATTGITFDNSSKAAEDYFQNTLEYDWHLMSTPLSNASMGTDGNYNMNPSMLVYGLPQNLIKMEDGYFPNGLKVLSYNDSDVKWDFYSYDEPDYHWINFKRSTGNHWHIDTIAGTPNPPIHYSGLNTLGDYTNEANYIPGKGYMMAISQDSYLSNHGILNKGDVSIDLTAMAPEDISGKPTYDKGSNLVGNPYQAYLDLTKVTAAHSTLTDFYIYDADQGVYAPYTEEASVNPRIPSRYIHPHQGFFVLTTTDQNLTFNTDMATATADPTSIYRGDDRINYPLLNLLVFDTLGNRDLAIVELMRPELGGVKKVNNLRNADFKLYAHYDGEDYGLLFTPQDAERVPLFFKTPHDGQYTLRWDSYNGTFSSLLLLDNITGKYYDMLANDHYTFDALATDYAARFYIVFTVTDVDEYGDDDTNDNFAYYNGYGWVIEGQGQLELVDMLGRVLYTDYLFGEETLVHFDGIAAGMYMLRLVDGSKVKAVQKIVIRR